MEKVKDNRPSWLKNVHAGRAPAPGHPRAKEPPPQVNTPVPTPSRSRSALGPGGGPISQPGQRRRYVGGMTPDQDAASRAFDEVHHRTDYMQVHAERGEHMKAELAKRAKKEKS